MILEITLALVVTTFLSFILVKWKHQYWKRRGVPQFSPHIIFGDMGPIFTGSASYKDFFIDIYHRAKSSGYKYVGLYATFFPQLLVLDLNLVKRVLSKDFDYFNSRDSVNHKFSELTNNLLGMDGGEWKVRRRQLTPLFTSGKLKTIFEILAEIGNKMVDTLNKMIEENQPVPAKDICARFTTDAIASVAFGLECNSLKEPNHIFRVIGRQVLQGNILKMALENFVPHNILHAINYQKFTPQVRNYFKSIVTDTISYREKNNITRNDFLQLMIDQKKHQTNKSLSDKEIVDESFAFYLAGFETSSTTMTNALVELAQNQDIQEKLRKEIFAVLEKHDGNISYDSMMEMEYLEKVFNETLRKHPILYFLKRKCTKKYTIPDTNVQIEKGVRVLVPVIGLHMDPEYYENPEQFNPDNFSPEKIAKRPDFAYLPFGEGPRSCIGMRYGKMQSKIGLVRLLTNFKFTLHETMKPPFKTKTGTKNYMFEHEILLVVSKITKF